MASAVTECLCVYSICVCRVEGYAITQYIICPSIGVCTAYVCVNVYHEHVCTMCVYNVYIRVIFVHVCTRII